MKKINRYYVSRSRTSHKTIASACLAIYAMPKIAYGYSIYDRETKKNYVNGLNAS